MTHLIPMRLRMLIDSPVYVPCNQTHFEWSVRLEEGYQNGIPITITTAARLLH